MNIYETRVDVINRLTPAVGQGEARAMTDEIIEYVTGRDRVNAVMNGSTELEPESTTRINGIIDRIIAGEPLQYILGEAYFAGLKLKVSPAVLIPRPETAQLVDMICDDCGHRTDLHILDVCTGSGCIALALARRLKFAGISAVDISEDALDIARFNAHKLHVDISFSKVDALSLPTPSHPIYDVIVSNPPYVALSERTGMERRVLDHEPSIAIFVEDSDPLKFYTAIARYGISALKPDGTLYFEINPLFVTQLSSQLRSIGWSDIEILPDFRSQKRFAICRR